MENRKQGVPKVEEMCGREKKKKRKNGFFYNICWMIHSDWIAAPCLGFGEWGIIGTRK